MPITTALVDGKQERTGGLRSLRGGRGSRSAFDVVARFGLGGLDSQYPGGGAGGLRGGDFGLRRDRAGMKARARRARNGTVTAIWITIAVQQMMQEVRSGA